VSLAIYSSPDIESKYITTSPFTVTFDGRIGGSIDKRVYVRNDDSSRYYTDIQLNPINVSGEGYSWKLMEKDIAPTNIEWEAATSSLTLSVGLGSSSSGNITTFLPVWVRVVTPRSQRIQTITDVVLRITATEVAI